ncbi:MAG TPA: hypothetical protein VLX31_16720 [Streptosporangiaceae bacterium]|nr:hypothetical protein [Streptosporangiaceae bacterium]
MSNKIIFYAIIGRDSTVDRPLGLLRRLEYDNGSDDEGLSKDMSWSFTPIIVEWERSNYGNELVEVSHEQASKIVQYFREKFERETTGGASADG